MKFRSLLPFQRKDESNALSSLRKEIDDLFNTWAETMPFAGLLSDVREFWPSMNVSETDKDVVLTAELPGVDEKNIDVSVSDDQITINGEKRSEVDEKKEEKGRTFRRVECSYGSFHRSMVLPFKIDPDKVQASVKNGVLTVTIPKPPEAQRATKKIAIKGEKPSIEAKKAA